jgi:hypothetical protein
VIVSKHTCCPHAAHTPSQSLPLQY